jgi:hypothetical protein
VCHAPEAPDGYYRMLRGVQKSTLAISMIWTSSPNGRAVLVHVGSRADHRRCGILGYC